MQKEDKSFIMRVFKSGSPGPKFLPSPFGLIEVAVNKGGDTLMKALRLQSNALRQQMLKDSFIWGLVRWGKHSKSPVL